MFAVVFVCSRREAAAHHRKLLRDKMIVGVRLVYSPTKDFFCASCVYAKATQKPAPKMRESERADVFGGEVNNNKLILLLVRS